MFPNSRAWIVVFPLMPSIKSTQHVSLYMEHIWFPQGPWGHMVQFTGIFNCSLDVLQGSFLFGSKVGIFPCLLQSIGGEMAIVECTFSGNQRVYQMLCFFVVGDARWSHFVFYFEGKSKSILWIIRHLETFLKWKILEIHRIYLPSFLAMYLATTSSFAVNSCLYCSAMWWHQCNRSM